MQVRSATRDESIAQALDRPVWASLTTHHRRLSEGGDLARRFLPDVNLFASTAQDRPEEWGALAALVKPGESIYLMQDAPVTAPAAFEELKSALAVQMIVARSMAAAAAGGDDIQSLSEAEAPEMIALATLTQPGPFLARTHTMGNFIGIRVGGVLAAMAGERLRFPGHTEVSGVCTHPDFRGQGYARRLSLEVARRIEARGDVPFLHAWSSNRPAIALYESLGFELRAELNISLWRRRASP